MKKFLFIATAFVIASCSGKKESGFNKFSDDVHVSIADFQDRRLSDSLFQFFHHPTAAYRRDAAMAFASVQDTTAVEALGKMLTDSDREVRKAAATALGQTGGVKALAFLKVAVADTTIHSEVWEALGKAAEKSEDIPDQVSAWGLYRLGLRGKSDSTHVTDAITYLQAADEDSRLGAAHFLARGSQKIDEAQAALLTAATADKSVYVRMAAVLALRKIKTQEVRQALTSILTSEKDYRVRVNAIRGLQSFPIAEVMGSFKKTLNDSNVHVAIASAEAVKTVVTKNEINDLLTIARSTPHWRVRGNLYEAILTLSNDKEIAEELFRLYSTLSNPYARAALLTALGSTPIAYQFITDKVINDTVPIIRSAGAAALVSINRSNYFDKELQKKFATLYPSAMQTGDPAVIGTIASALADSTLGYRNIITDFSFLYDAKKRLSLPKDNEALQPLEEAIAHFEKRKITEPVKNEFNHPIDWTLVKSISKNQKVRITTSKGEIVLTLLVEEAPGSVANFVSLVNTGYFNNKNFHRVVPNFVIQGGCNRGDGWGSEDYSIRSEFSARRYAEGSVGMASAGKDTEGTQWFITHSPTPHLDGRYTIFAMVETGMEVVHRIEVGDVILSVELMK